MMDYDYERVRIKGRLVCLTPLSVGSGEPPTEFIGKDQEPANRLDICKRADGKPYVPGSSLRGLLSSLLPARDPAHAALFGKARGEEKDSQAGSLRVYDAVLDMATGQAADRPRTSIDPITGTAKDQHLYSLVQLPAGAEFDCEFEIERGDKAMVETFFGLLAQLHSDNPQARLGKGGNKSEGRIMWKADRQSVHTLTPAKLANWLLSKERVLPFDSGRHFKATVKANAEESDELSFRLELRPSGPLLVDPNRPESKKISTDPDRFKAQKDPDMIYRRETRDGKTLLIVSASSLRGLLRAHCRKILLTLLVERSEEKPCYSQSNALADELIDELFGHEGRASAVVLADATASAHKPHRQTFNAVDRFTGGVADTALYTVEAAAVDALETTLRIQTRFLPLGDNWWKGLLILALRDAMEGDLALGWGKAKGYGAFKLARVETRGHIFASWHECVNNSEHLQQARAWVAALHEKITEQVAK